MACKLRIAWSVGCVILCLLLIALWVKSYWRLDYYHGYLWTSTATKSDLTRQAYRWPGVFATSRQGRFYIYFTPQYALIRSGSTIRQSLPIDEERADFLRDEIGFELNDIQTPRLTRYSVASPYWAPLALVVAGFCPLDSIAFQPPHTVNRHDAGCSSFRCRDLRGRIISHQHTARTVPRNL